MKEKLKRFWDITKLRLSLFRVWFFKNILVFIQVFLVVSLVLMFCGVITSETPLLGVIIYPFFSPLMDEINTIIAEKEIDGVMSFLGVAISVLMSLCLFTAKTKSIAEKDIKNTKMKLALVKANLYFNTDGKLVKKVEKVTGTDLDGDGIVDGEPQVTSGFFTGIRSAWEELVTILSVKFGYDETDEETQEKYEETIREAGLDTAKEGIDEIDEILVSGTEQIILDKVDDIVNETVDKLDEDDMVQGITGDVVKKSGSKVKGFFSGLFRRKKEENDIEIIENNDSGEVENDVIEEKVEEGSSVKIEVTKEEIKVMKNDVPVVDAKLSEKDQFLAQLRNRKK